MSEITPEDVERFIEQAHKVTGCELKYGECAHGNNMAACRKCKQDRLDALGEAFGGRLECPGSEEEIDRLNARIKELEDLLRQRDGGDHDNDCKVNYGRGCNCMHNSVTRYFEKRQGNV